jgi:hypothetical protein
VRLQGRLLRSYTSCTNLCLSRALAGTGLPGPAATCHTQVCSLIARLSCCLE